MMKMALWRDTEETGTAASASAAVCVRERERGSV